MMRLARAWGGLTPEQRIAALAALALLVTMFFPWYDLQSLNRKTGTIDSHSISAFGDVSFVEAAVFLVSAGVIALLFARAERRDFHMPGGDGAVVMVAGGWAALLIFYRVFSRPAGHGYPVGIEWGFFLAFVAAGALAYAGWRMRATNPPEPPLVRGSSKRHAPPDEGVISSEDDVTVVTPARTVRRTSARPAPAPPAWSAPSTQRTPRDSAPSTSPIRPKAPAPAGQDTPLDQASAKRRPRYPPAPAEQLSFEDQPPERDER